MAIGMWLDVEGEFTAPPSPATAVPAWLDWVVGALNDSAEFSTTSALGGVTDPQGDSVTQLRITALTVDSTLAEASVALTLDCAQGTVLTLTDIGSVSASGAPGVAISTTGVN
jgi:hypothetical protein